jgi:glycosyltransferase involved in cell wall biosynthesis
VTTVGEPASPSGAPRATGFGRRAVILVGNPANPYSRAIRVARALEAEGFAVEIAATHDDAVPDAGRDGTIDVRRYPPSGRFAARAARYRGRPPVPPSGGTRITRVLRARRERLIEWAFWPQTVRGWWATLERDLAPAHLYHACGVLALPPALAARRRDQRAGRTSRVVYDVIDITLESNQVLRFPPLVRRLLGRRERRWARAADAHVAVNEPFAARAVARWGLARPPLVVANYPEPWVPPAGPAPDRVRGALGLPPTTRVCLFWGRIGPNLGLDEAARAVLDVDDAVLVVLGFGRGWAASVDRDHDPGFAGRHFTLPAVHPDELLSWIASADVALVTLPPVSYNQRFTTPNKFLEAIAAGVPIVLGPDLPTMADQLVRHDLGRIAASMDPADIATAIRGILDLPAGVRADWRARLAALGRERYSWPVAAEPYRRLVARLVEGG